MSANTTSAQQEPRYTGNPAADAERYFDALDDQDEAWGIAEAEVRSGITAQIKQARAGVPCDVGARGGISLRTSYLMNSDPLWNKAFVVLAAATGEAADAFWSAVEDEILEQSEDEIEALLPEMGDDE